MFSNCITVCFSNSSALQTAQRLRLRVVFDLVVCRQETNDEVMFDRVKRDVDAIRKICKCW